MVQQNVKRVMLEALKAIPQGSKFVLGTSGGPDSQCLLHAFPRLVGPSNCLAVGVNHGLRAEAGSELDLAEQLAGQVGVEWRRIELKVRAGGNLLSRARDARYEALRRVAVEHFPGQKTFIVVAHHADDRAETVLIRLMRSTSVGCLAVMPPLAGDIFRPMLEMDRSGVSAHLNRFRVKYAEDPSNTNEKYLRAWVRATLLPTIKTKCPNVVKRLNKISDDLLEHS